MRRLSARFHTPGLLVAALLAAPLPLQAEETSPPFADPGDVLRLPGAPPIQLPPGTRVFGPNGPIAPPAAGGQTTAPDRETSASDKAEDKPPAAKPPHPDLNDPAGRKTMLDDLFGRLGKAQDDTEAQFITGAIERVWMRSGSDTADLLMDRALEAMRAKNWSLSEQVLDKVVALSPDWAEAWNQRATDRYLADNYDGAIADVAHVLAIEPRHFGALAGLGFMLRRMDMKARALQAFRKALEVNPRQDDIRKLVDQLTIEVEGRDL